MEMSRSGHLRIWGTLRRAVASSGLGIAGLVGLQMVLVTAPSCQAPTELTLNISTDAQCGVEVKTTAIYVAQSPSIVDGNVQSRSPIAQTDACTNGVIGSLVVTPGGDDGAVVIVAGFDGKSPTDCVEGNYVNCIIARRSFSFIKHTPLSIPVILERDCLNVPCDAVSTCHNGACYSSSLDCSGSSCDAIGSNDAGPVDAGPGSVLQADGAPEEFPEAGGSDGSSREGGGGNDAGSGGNDAGDAGDAGDGGLMSTDGGSFTGLSCMKSGNDYLVTGCASNQTCTNMQCCGVPPDAPSFCRSEMVIIEEVPKACCQPSECTSGMCCGGQSLHRREPFVCSPIPPGELGHCM